MKEAYELTQELLQYPDFEPHPDLKYCKADTFEEIAELKSLNKGNSQVKVLYMFDLRDDFTFTYCFDFLLAKAQLSKELRLQSVEEALEEE